MAAPGTVGFLRNQYEQGTQLNSNRQGSRSQRAWRSWPPSHRRVRCLRAPPAPSAGSRRRAGICPGRCQTRPHSSLPSKHHTCGFSQDDAQWCDRAGKVALEVAEPAGARRERHLSLTWAVLKVRERVVLLSTHRPPDSRGSCVSEPHVSPKLGGPGKRPANYPRFRRRSDGWNRVSFYLRFTAGSQHIPA